MPQPKIIGVIPARYQSSRFPGKPLADICGKPMIWWVYQQVSKVEELDEIYVATDDERIKNVCEEYGMNVVMTRNDHPNGTERIQEVSQKILADFYVVINGDEPLISPTVISAIIPNTPQTRDVFVRNLMTVISNPVEALDPSNIKVVVDVNDNALLFSRNMIPYPKSSLNYDFYKHVGILMYNKIALDFFVNTPKGPLEKIEDVNELRYLEHGKSIKMIKVDTHSLSVDTPKDLEKVRLIIERRDNA